MDEEQFDRSVQKKTDAMLSSELMHREQIREIELRKAMNEAKASEFMLLAAEVQCRKALGLPTKELNDIFRAMSAARGEVQS